MNRRQFLRLSAGATAAAGVAASGSTPAVAQSTDPLEEWFADVDNYEGVLDWTGRPEVPVEVGAEANGGGFGFGPAAIRVDPGTTVVWEWTGAGGVHNVAARDGDFESEMTDESGATFEHTFESEGVYRYSCTPHEAMGMKGAVVVGDAGVGSADGAAGGSVGTGGSVGAAEFLTGGLAGAILVALFVLPLSELRKRRGHPSRTVGKPSPPKSNR